MKSISFNTGEFKQEKTSAWLLAFMQFGKTIGVFDLLGQVRVKMKEVDYSVHQKFITLMLSVAIGCRYTSDINEMLVTDTVAARIFDMPRFPDQSQINELIRRADITTVEQLKEVHHVSFTQNARCLSTTETVVADIDQTGLIANGKTYKCADKGYFCKKKNQRGYQVSAAFCGGENSETLGMYLDPGNTHCSHRFEDLLKDILAKLPDAARETRLILRLDSGYGSDANVEKMRNKVLFVAKAYSTVRAANIAKTIKKEDWEEIDDCVDTYELPNTDVVRYIIVRTLTRKGDFEYTMLISNIPAIKMSAHDLYHFYNGRQTIEAFFKMCKNIYHIENLRTRSFEGIYTFLWTVFITHNIISWMKKTTFSDSKLEGVGTKTLIEKLGSIAAEVKETLEGIIVTLPSISTLARKFVECMQPKYEQLTLFTLH
jgi:hypothetical protein